MGIFQHPIEVSGSEQGPFITVSAVVDTGATYTLIPERVLQELGVRPRETQQFLIADGRTVDRRIAFIFVRIDDRVRPTICIVGDDGTPPLLGAVTLEEFGMAADPVKQRLVPLPHLYLLTSPHFGVREAETTYQTRML